MIFAHNSPVLLDERTFYRRRDKATTALDDDASQTTFILRCADCEGFTTVQALTL